MPEGKPTVSAVLLTYNCQAFVIDAVRSTLAQDFDGPIEILISDDASTDRTAELAQAEVDRYRGPHTVRVVRQRENYGSKSAHLNRVVASSSGELIISFDGDDISEPQRVRKLVEMFRSDPTIHAVYSDFALIDEAGRARGPGGVPHPESGTRSRDFFARVDAYAAGATLAVRRSVFEAFPPLDPDIHEDIVLPFRASLLGKTVFIDQPLVRARRHATSFTADLDRFASLSAYRARMWAGIERARRNVASRLQDIEAAQAMMPDRAEELETLRSVVYQSLAIAELSGEILSPSRLTRVSGFLRLVRAGAYPEYRFQHAALALAPEIYLRYKRRQLSLAAADSS